VRRFIDPAAIFHYVAAEDVLGFAQAHGATPFDVPGVAYGHAGERCSFDAFLALHRLDDPALRRLAAIVRAADTSGAGAGEASGLVAISQGLGRLIGDDQALLHAGLLLYDALYLECRARGAAARGSVARAA
jgi:hypothetical protein